MKHTQYCHVIFGNNKGGKTYCVNVPEKNEFISLVMNNALNGQKIVLDVGVAICNNSDRYVKKIGREISSERLKPVEFSVQHMYKHNEKTFISLLSDLGKFLFRMSDKSDKIWLLEVDN